MKFACYLLLIMITWLVMVPCMDSRAAKTDQPTVRQVPLKNFSLCSATVDDCSPFCSCTCCSTPSLYKDSADHSAIPTFYAGHYFSVDQDDLPVATAPVWLPPKILA
jgi:hypothetical protein